MVLFPLLLLLLLGIVEEVTASVLLGRQRPPSDGGTTLALDKRQGSTVFTTFSVIFREGDASRRRTAESGFDIRVDVVNSAWGFCGSNNPKQCDMAGVCFDNFSCSTGCGSGNPALKTWTCAGTKARYCSTDLLTLSSDSPDAVTYLACGDRPDRTQLYKAFTTTATPSTSSSTAATPLPTPQQTSQITTTDTSPSETAAASTDSANNDSNNTNSADTNTSTSTSTDTAMIVGASIGCVALICICVVVVFLIRRSRATSAATAATTATTGEATTGGAAVVPAQGGYKPPPGVFDGGHPVYEIGHGYPATAPVELPGTRW
ncbi:hypothetical protein F5144DRAFT_229611 [Chaetomium tenue]|uniref:Uncharacterized protein n=1 Tax=Chaetomium tenue TaxID=1854479 RepID=A0ACB7P5Z6_9PEZI|nr:hypothetical protein F5144DRAFT_229611 [Chaetomium globosum]